MKLSTTGFLSGKFDEARLDGLMNDLGEQGWELAMGLDLNEVYGKSSEVVIVFKRPKKQPRVACGVLPCSRPLLTQNVA